MHHRHWLFAALVAVFFLCARAGSLAHATSYGTAPHQHDNKLCMLSVVVDEDDQDDLALPPSAITLPLPALRYQFEAIVMPAPIAPHALSTHARDPPLTQ